MSVGSVGLAIIVSNGEHRVILYRSKQDVLSTFSMDSSAKVIYVKKDYIQYHDDVAQFWSIRFAIDADREEFLTNVNTHCSIDKETVDVVPDKDKTPQPISEPPMSNNQSALLHRMAKMGQQIIPSAVLPSKELSSDSEDGDANALQHQIVSPKWKPDVPSRNNQLKYPSNKSPVLSANTLISYNPLHAMTNDPEIVSLFTENRFQNTEVRMCLSKLESKIERVLDKVDSIRESNSSTKPKTDLEEDIIKLEEKLLNLKKENRQLRLNQEADSQSDKALLSEQNKNSMLKVRLDNQAVEIEELRKCVATKESEINRIELLRLASEDRNKTQTIELQSQIEELTRNQEQSSKDVAELQTSVKELEGDKLKLVEQLANLQSKPTSSGIEISAVVKDIMNTMYQSIQETVCQRSEWSADEVLKLMRTVIKGETMNVLGLHPSP